MTHDNSIKLAAPGAGLPPLELFIARLVYPLQLRFGNKDSFRQLFQKERGAIGLLLEKLQSDEGEKRVLIKRPMGLEDSSRYWSIWMTLDHLRIVNDALSRIIPALSKGMIPPDAASIASVKPSAEVTAAVASDYEASCDRFLKIAEGIKNLKTTARYSHPWFGPMDAYGWYALGCVHLGLHRVQIERILEWLHSPVSRN